MTYKLDDKKYAAACKQSDEKRLSYFLRKVADFEEIWSLHSEDGWVELSDEDGQVCLPIWPHPDFAAAWVDGQWNDCVPKRVKLDEWLERWTDGLEKDETVLAIFPVDNGEGIILSPNELHEALLAELES